jgi:hypothetical protein
MAKQIGRWVREMPPRRWQLRAGGAVLATIAETGTHRYEWRLSSGRTGVHRTQYGAQLAARRALREEATSG